MKNETLCGALGAWGKTLGRRRPDLCGAGSPERSMGRVVVESRGGELLLVERLFKEGLARKGRMAELQEVLEQEGLSVKAPLRNLKGEHLSCTEGGWFQITPYVKGSPLGRPTYLGDAWRGEKVAEFLVGLRRAEPLCRGVTGPETFDLPSYIKGLMVPVKKEHPKLFDALQEVNGWLADRLFLVWKELPSALCHGDVHGMNIIWGERGIKAVIDWEFYGRKPELYDAANMVGCCGMENPSGLLSGLAPALVGRLREEGFASERSWSLFPELLVGLRYAWLSEWLRKKDREMIRLELSFIYLLMDHREKIASALQSRP